MGDSLANDKRSLKRDAPSADGATFWRFTMIE